MSNVNWNCSICETNESFPMMIVFCGHTFCDNCIQKIQKCPICRTNFSQFDLQPNYAVCSNAQQQLRLNSENLTPSFHDLIRQRRIYFRSVVQSNLREILKQLQTLYSEQQLNLNYTCVLQPDNLPHPIIDSIIKKLYSMGFKSKLLQHPVTLETSPNRLEISIRPDFLELDMSPLPTRTTETQSDNTHQTSRLPVMQSDTTYQSSRTTHDANPGVPTTTHILISRPSNQLDNNQQYAIYTELVNGITRSDLFADYEDY